MQEKPNIEELIADSMTLLLIRAQNLPKRERLAIAQEFLARPNRIKSFTQILPDIERLKKRWIIVAREPIKGSDNSREVRVNKIWDRVAISPFVVHNPVFHRQELAIGPVS